MKSRPKTSHVGEVTITTMYSKRERLWVTMTNRPDASINIETGNALYEVGEFQTYTSREEATWDHYFNRGIYDAFKAPVGSYPQPLRVSYLHRRRR